MGSDPGGGEEVRGATGGRALSRRLLRLAVVGVVAIGAVVLLVPTIRDLATAGEEDQVAFADGRTVDKAAVTDDGRIVGVGADIEDDTIKPGAYIYEDGEWRVLGSPIEASYLNDVAVEGELVVIVGSAEDGSPAVWRGEMPDPVWREEELPGEGTSMANAVAIRGTTVVAAGMSLVDDTLAPATFASVDGGEWTETRHGEQGSLFAIALNSIGFVVGGTDGEQPLLISSTDGITWNDPTPVDSPSGAIDLLATHNDNLLVVGRSERAATTWTVGIDSFVPAPLPTPDAGQRPAAAAAADSGEWVIAGIDVEVGDVVTAIVWRSKDGATWSEPQGVAADRLSDIVIVDGHPFGVGVLERGAKTTPALIPL